MRYINLIILFSTSIFCNGQKINLLDLNKIIEKGICSERNKACLIKQLKYLNACNSLGDYYFRLKNYKLALKYYLTGSDIGEYTEAPLEFDKPIILRNKISEKTGNIYYYGYGTKINKEKAFFFHCRYPMFLTKKQRIKYSKLYFNSGNQKVLLKIDSSENTKSIGLNPFFIDNNSLFKNLDSQFSFYEKKLIADTNLTCKINITYGSLLVSEINEHYLNAIISNLKIINNSVVIDTLSYINRTSAEVDNEIRFENSFIIKNIFVPTITLELHRL